MPAFPDPQLTEPSVPDFTGSRVFEKVFAEGMSLVEQTASYLDGPGRDMARKLPREALVLTAKSYPQSAALIREAALKVAVADAQHVPADGERGKRACARRAHRQVRLRADRARLDAATVAYVLEHSDARRFIADERYEATCREALATLQTPPPLGVVGGRARVAVRIFVGLAPAHVAALAAALATSPGLLALEQALALASETASEHV